MATMTGGEVLARQLATEGIDRVFLIPGVQLDHATEGLRRLEGKVALTVPRHEQATSYMADGYARSTGKIGVCMVVPGPGLLNATAGLATAYGCNSRVFCIAAQIHSGGIGRGFGLLHEVPNQSETLASVTKWSAMARSPAEIPGLVRKAVSELRSGRPRPVGLEIPPDILAAEGDVDLFPPSSGQDGRVPPDSGTLLRAAELLDRASYPVIVVGGGVIAAGLLTRFGAWRRSCRLRSS
ncbi:MAG: hypothetical protein HY900_34690 [Deltaproteobacteria bacterium]|nr:hypothetical protein [Deltaproteobacteria bacterium]